MIHVLIAVFAWIAALFLETAESEPETEEQRKERESIEAKERAFKQRVAKASAALVEAFKAGHETLMSSVVPRLADRMFSLRVLFSNGDGHPDFDGRSAGYRDAIRAVKAEVEEATNDAEGRGSYESLRVMASTYISTNIADMAGKHRAAYVRDGYEAWTQKKQETAQETATTAPQAVSAPTQLGKLAREAVKASRKGTDNPTGRPDVDGILATVNHALGMAAQYLDPRDPKGNAIDVGDRAWKPNTGDVTRWTEAIASARTLIDRISGVVETGSKTLKQAGSNRNPRTGGRSKSKAA